MTGQIYTCFELRVPCLWETLLTVLCTWMCSTRLRWALVLQTTNVTSVLATRKCHGKLHKRWMEDFRFHLSLSEFSQVSIYLFQFHIDYWTIAKLQTLFISSKLLQACWAAVLSSFLLPLGQLGFDSYQPIWSKEPMLTKSHSSYFRVE